MDAKRLGLAGGILWGAIMLVFTWIAVLTGYGEGFLTIFGNLYWGYSITWLGSIIGAIYGFVDAFVGLYLLAWIYNKL
jgi:hypothetical protein